MSDTIIAQATPPGKSGVAILRLSGNKVVSTLQMLQAPYPLKPRYAHYATLKHPVTQQIIDQGLVIFFPAPHSFTGEDVVEIHCHGSRIIIQELLNVLLSIDGIRYAEAGEFSRRALENGKMDLIQVEALMDVIDAETSEQKALAMHQLRGDISHHYGLLETTLIEARAFCEVFIDFPEDDLPPDMDEQINGYIYKAAELIERFLATAQQGKQIREGIQVAIIGIPNVGKSTLINQLAGKQIAITSSTAGTTRDVIELYKDINGIPYRFFDTAGIRESRDEIENKGISLAKDTSYKADITILLLDGTQSVELQMAALAEIVSRETILVINKSDLIPHALQNVSRETISISAKSGEGISELIKQIETRVLSRSQETVYVTRERHAAHLREAIHTYSSHCKHKISY